MAKPKQLTLRRHIEKMLDVCGPSYGPVVGLICYKAAHHKRPDLEHKHLMARMPDQRLSLFTCPFYTTIELRSEYENPHG